MPPKTKILLVDDHPLVCEWLSKLIHQEPDLEVCGQASSPRTALSLIGAQKPDVVVADIILEGGSGLELIKDIKALYPRVISLMLSMHDEKMYAERAMRAGAAGYIMKSEATKKILAGIRTVVGGGVFYSDTVNALLAKKFVQGKAGQHTPIETLSDRELEVFRLLGHGMNTRQISEQMNISFKTVQTYCARIKEKLNYANINELTFHAIHWHAAQGGT
jgi:DNA-binding NarL/FixJ family response regulator